LILFGRSGFSSLNAIAGKWEIHASVYTVDVVWVEHFDYSQWVMNSSFQKNM